MNIDPANGVTPSSVELLGFGHVRFAYNISRGTGSTDLKAAQSFYAPAIASYLAADITPILVLTHETWGEGRGFNWHAMSDADWSRLIEGYADQCGKVAQVYGGLAIYQIWNEGDSASEAAVGIPAKWYARLLDATYATIRAKAPNARIISQGHVLNQPNYWTAVRQSSRFADALDAVCIHAYGHGPAGPFSPFGSLGTVITRWKQVTRAPIWITEWGLLNMTASAQQAAGYAAGFIEQARIAGVKQVCWFAWSNQHNNVPVAGNSMLKDALLR